MSRSTGLALVVGIATAAVWLLLGGLHWAPRVFTTLLLVPVPALLLLQARLTDELPDSLDRESIYFSSALSTWILAGFAMLAARVGNLSRTDLRLSSLPVGELAIAAALTVAGGLALMAAGRLLRVTESRLIAFLIPRTGSEKIAFVGLSVSAGIGEELVFRSFLIAALRQAGASLSFAVGASVVAFAVAHSYQGAMGVVRVALLGVVMTVPYLVTGSVYPSIVAHAALDILAGLVLADWLLAPTREEGD